MFDNEYISLESISVRLNLPEKYLKELVEEGKIPYLAVGKRKRFQEQAVRDALSELERDKPETNRIQALSSRLRSAIALITQEGGRVNAG